MYIYIYKICHRSLFRGHFEPWNCYLFGERCVGWTNETKPREKERGGRGEFADITIWPARNPLLAKLWSYRAATCQLQATPIENVGRSSRVQGAPREFQTIVIVARRILLSYDKLGRCDIRIEESGCLDRFRGRDIDQRWNFSRGSTFVRENCDEMQRHLANWLLFDNVDILYTRPRDSKLVSLLSNIQRVSNSHSRPMNRERDSFPASTRGKKRREERNGSSWRSANRFVCAANESRLRIDHESFARGKWIFFPGTKEICFEGCDRRQFSILTANSSRLLDPRAKIRACLFPNCHRGRGGTERDERRDRHWWI